MTRYDSPPASNVSVAINIGLTLIALLAAVVSVICYVSDGQPHSDSTRIGRLERAVAEQLIDVTDLRARVLQLERPDEPVYPPRHPGRIGGKPVIPWIEPWSGSASPIAPSIGASIDSEPPIGRTIDQ